MKNHYYCGKPHSMYRDLRCILPVDDKGQHAGYCVCAYNTNGDVTKFFHDPHGKPLYIKKS